MSAKGSANDPTGAESDTQLPERVGLEVIQRKVSKAEVASEPDEYSASEARDLEQQWQDAELENFRQEIKLREEYAAKLFRLTRWWIIGIGALLLLEGFGATTTFDLPDNVLMTAIGGTTVTVTGLFVVVVRYLFPRAEPDGPAPRKKPKQEKQEG